MEFWSLSKKYSMLGESEWCDILMKHVRGFCIPLVNMCDRCRMFQLLIIRLFSYLFLVLLQPDVKPLRAFMLPVIIKH